VNFNTLIKAIPTLSVLILKREIPMKLRKEIKFKNLDSFTRHIINIALSKTWNFIN